MITLLRFLALFVLMSLSVRGASTINVTDRYAYGANIGWIDWRADGTNGAVVGEYVCSGYLYSANVGWIHLGTGAPTNGIRYQNNSDTDYGVNHDGLGGLRGYAYGANIGWVQFEASGDPRVDLRTGTLNGHIYSANCGWISLSNAVALVKTDVIRAGVDSDGDGITDAWELSYTNTLAGFSAVSDTDGDGMTDLAEHRGDTNPLNGNDALRITGYSAVFGGGLVTNRVEWLSKETRQYRLNIRTNLNPEVPGELSTDIIVPDTGLTTRRELVLPAAAPGQRYFRLEAIKPLAP